MPRSHKPRKRYVPKHARLDAHLVAVDRIATLLPHQQQELTGPTKAALEAFRRGLGDADHWCNLADACNVGEALAGLRIGGDALLPIFAAAQTALAAVHARRQAGGSWTLRGTEISALDEGWYWAAWQLTQASQGEVFDAVQTVKRRVQGALAGSAGGGVTVCVGGLGRSQGAAC